LIINHLHIPSKKILEKSLRVQKKILPLHSQTREKRLGKTDSFLSLEKKKKNFAKSFAD
jgi:hypothetical protein